MHFSVDTQSTTLLRRFRLAGMPTLPLTGGGDGRQH
jgi:hypothetical protein